MMKAIGGKNIFGFSIGILMLESKFPRIPGDMGNATTWDFPVLYKVVKNASPDSVVRKGDRNLLELLYHRGQGTWKKKACKAITTNCGFLAMFHNEMAAAVNSSGIHLQFDAGAACLCHAEANPAGRDHYNQLQNIKSEASWRRGGG